MSPHHLEVTIRLHGAPMRDGAVVTVTVTETGIVKDTGAVNETAADEEDQSTGHRQAIVTRAGKGEGMWSRNWNGISILYCTSDLNLGLDLIHPWKKNMELGKRHFYMEYVNSMYFCGYDVVYFVLMCLLFLFCVRACACACVCACTRTHKLMQL